MSAIPEGWRIERHDDIQPGLIVINRPDWPHPLMLYRENDLPSFQALWHLSDALLKAEGR